MTQVRALDPDAQRLLNLAAEAGYPPFEALSPARARKAYAASWSVMQAPGGDVASVRRVLRKRLAAIPKVSPAPDPESVWPSGDFKKALQVRLW